MRAIQIKQPGGVEELQLMECPLPTCGTDDVLIEVKVAGINFIDVYFRNGVYKAPQFPFIPGKEGSGIVSAVGKNVKDFVEGDRVAFCAGGSGSYAEYVCIPASQVVLIPDSLSFENAAAVMLQGITAYYLTHYTYNLHPNHTCLIHAGAGGVGLLLIQMAKRLNAKVITTVSTEAKANLAKMAGADEVIFYTQESFLDAVMRITNNVGVNVVYDSVGKTTFSDSLKALTVRGMLASFGQSSGMVPPVEISSLAEKSLFLTRPQLGHYTRTAVELKTMSSALFNLLANDQLKVTIGQHYALADAAKAHTDLEARKTFGKSILMI